MLGTIILKLIWGCYIYYAFERNFSLSTGEKSLNPVRVVEMNRKCVDLVWKSMRLEVRFYP